MEVTLQPGAVNGVVFAPASKSMMQRGCAAALLHKGETLIHNYGRSEDEQAALDIIVQLGAQVEMLDERRLKITGPGMPQPAAGAVISCGESGLSLRMFTPIAALGGVPLSITGKGSLPQRPVAFMAAVLQQLGVGVGLAPEGLPMQLEGSLLPADIVVDGTLTSQFLTGLLFAYAACNIPSRITVSQLKSRPYIDLTLQVLAHFGMPVPGNEDYGAFVFDGSTPAAVKPVIHFDVEGDWSNAAFLLVAGAIAGHVTVKGLDVFSLQADKKILEALQDCGCRLSIQAAQVEAGHGPLKAFHFNATDCPDLFPPLVVLAACCRGTSVIEGLHRLRHKESDRAHALQEEGRKLGIDITVQDDALLVRGGVIRSATVDAHNDHRIAMACAVAGLAADGPVTIGRAEAVRKSYPDFFERLQTICVRPDAVAFA